MSRVARHPCPRDQGRLAVNAQSPLAAGNLIPDQASPCRLCGAELKHTLVDLGMSPMCESIRTPRQLDEMEAYFPLHALICDSASLCNSGNMSPRKRSLREYAYFSSYSTSWVAHAKAYCEVITQRLALDSDSLVVELASNDGYLLQHFSPLRHSGARHRAGGQCGRSRNRQGHPDLY